MMPGLDGAQIAMSLSGPQALLVHQALGALLYSFHGVRYVEQTGLDQSELEKLMEQFQSWVNTQRRDDDGVIVLRDSEGKPLSKLEKNLRPIQVRAVRNALEVTMLEMGRSEFQTITGFSLNEGKQLLDRINALLLEPLQLDQQTSPVAH
jgi:hypothetical protein